MELLELVDDLAQVEDARERRLLTTVIARERKRLGLVGDAKPVTQAPPLRRGWSYEDFKARHPGGMPDPDPRLALVDPRREK
jgi:hypothetical protein